MHVFVLNSSFFFNLAKKRAEKLNSVFVHRELANLVAKVLPKTHGIMFLQKCEQFRTGLVESPIVSGDAY